MGLLGGLLGKIIAIVVLLAILLVAIGGFMYATDATVEATVVEPRCNPAGDRVVTVEPKLLPITRAVEVSAEQCAVVEPGNFVEYRIRSGRTTIYSSEGGTCLWDTEDRHPC